MHIVIKKVYTDKFKYDINTKTLFQVRTTKNLGGQSEILTWFILPYNSNTALHNEEVKLTIEVICVVKRNQQHVCNMICTCPSFHSLSVGYLPQPAHIIL